MRLLAMLAILVAIFGCATPAPQLAANQILIRHESQPTGAMIYLDDQSLGMAPFSKIYTANNRLSANGTGNMTFTAAWPSGAKIIKTFLMDVNKKNVLVSLSRPLNAPGMNVDMAHALQLQARDDAEKARADAAYRDALNSIATSISDVAKARNPPATQFTCTTIGIYTTCR